MQAILINEGMTFEMKKKMINLQKGRYEEVLIKERIILNNVNCLF